MKEREGVGFISDFKRLCFLPLIILSRRETRFIVDTFSFLEQSRIKHRLVKNLP